MTNQTTNNECIEKKHKTTLEEVLLYEAGYNTAKAEMEEKIEKIMKDINKGRHSEGWSQGKLKSILEKHLSPKE